MTTSSPRDSLRVFLFSANIQLLYFILLPLCVTMDSPFYLGTGWLQAHHLYFPVHDIRTPGYSTFLSLFFLFSPNLLVVSLAQHMAIASIAGLCTHILALRTKSWAAIFCGLSIGSLPSLGFYSSFIMSDALFSILLLGFVLGIIGGLGKSPRLFSWIGVLGGLLSLVRPNGVLIVLVSALLLHLFRPESSALNTKPIPFEQRYSFRILFWCFATILPWLVYRGVVTGHLGMLAPNRSPSLQMEMVLGIANNQIEEYLDPPFRSEVQRLKQEWDSGVAAENPGISFYYYLNPKLIILFGKESVTSFYQHFLWRYFSENPSLVMRRAVLTVLNLASLLPPSIADTYIENPDTTSGDILGCSTHNPLYREAKKVCSFEPFTEQLVQRSELISELAIKAFLTAARYVVFLVSCLALIRICYGLLTQRFLREETALQLICLIGIGITALGYAWLLKPSSRYAIPLHSLSFIAFALTFSRSERSDSCRKPLSLES